MRSEFLKLNLRDFLRGLIVATMAAALGVVYGAVNADNFDLTWIYWQPIVIDTIKASVQAFVAYLMLNLFTNQSGGLQK